MPKERDDSTFIIGTSHIAKESAKQVEQAILSRKPDIVAVELDHRRLHAIMGPVKPRFPLSMMKQVGVGGYFFLVIGNWLQRTLGRKIGTFPGTDMKAAIRAAAKTRARVALIDRDITITLRRLMKAVSWREKARFVEDVLLAFVGRGKSSHLAKKVDLARTPPDALLKEIMEYIGKRYPNVYRVLIKERNQIMADNIFLLREKVPGAHILVVVGAGHEQGLRALIEKEERHNH